MFGFGRGRQRELIELLRCSHPRSFGRRWERRIVIAGDTAELAESWPVAGCETTGDNAPMEWAVAFSGHVDGADGYEGCPHCGSRCWIRCDCGAVLCLGQGDNSDRCDCPCCGRRLSVGPLTPRLTVLEARPIPARLPGPSSKRLPAPVPAIPDMRR